MIDKEDAALSAYESLLAQLEFIPASQLPAVGSLELLMKSLDQGYAIITESVFRQAEKAGEDVYLYGFYCKKMNLGDSVLITSMKKSTLPKETEIGRFVPNRDVALREMKNAGKKSKCLLLKSPDGYDALCGTGRTIRPARVMIAMDDAVRELVRRYQNGTLSGDEPKPGEEGEAPMNPVDKFFGLFKKNSKEAPKKDIISLDGEY